MLIHFNCNKIYIIQIQYSSLKRIFKYLIFNISIILKEIIFLVIVSQSQQKKNWISSERNEHWQEIHLNLVKFIYFFRMRWTNFKMHCILSCGKGKIKKNTEKYSQSAKNEMKSLIKNYFLQYEYNIGLVKVNKMRTANTITEIWIERERKKWAQNHQPQYSGILNSLPLLLFQQYHFIVHIWHRDTEKKK